MPSDPIPPNNPNPAGKPRRKPAPGLGGNWLVVLIILFVVLLLWWGSTMPSQSSLTWGDFMALVNHQAADSNEKNPDYDAYKYLRNVTFVGDSTVTGQVDKDKLPSDLKYLEAEKLKTGHFTVHRLQVRDDKELQDRLNEIHLKAIKDAAAQPKAADGALPAPAFNWDQQDEPFAGLSGLFVMIVLPLLVIGALFFFLLPRFRDPLGGGFLSNYIKSPAKRYERSRNRITFDDVAGLQNSKSELQEVVEFLRDPQKFQRLGAVVPKGVLLVGPPGTGKTLLAKAVAGEAGVPFFSISGSEFIQMFVGVGASRVRDMFKTAKENAPCILFIDEIDAVGRMRGAGVGGGSDEREQTLNQILSEMDGFTPTESVIVMAATNRPDVLDSALLRPGRFDRHITVDRPTWQGRAAILKVHTRNKPLADDVNLEEVARGMIGMTGADLRNLANEAALVATREGKNRIDRHDFARAADRVLMGAKREEILTPEEKRRTAYHEAGHALVSLAAAGGRPAAQGDDRAARLRAGRNHEPARRGPAPPRPGLLARPAGVHAGRPGRRPAHVRPGIFRTRRRSQTGHAPGPLHGDALGHERPPRPHRVPRRRGARLPRQGDPGAARLQRGHGHDHRRGSAAHPARGGRPRLPADRVSPRQDGAAGGGVVAARGIDARRDRRHLPRREQRRRHRAGGDRQQGGVVPRRDICPPRDGVLCLEWLHRHDPSSRGPHDMDEFLDNLFDGLKRLEGRFIPRGWSATIVAGSVLCFAGLLLLIAFLLV